MESKRSPKSPRKISICQYENLQSIKEPTSSGDKTEVQVVVSMLSPKKGTFLDGSLADDSGRMRLVGFSDAKSRKLEDFFMKKGPVKLRDFRVQQAYSGGESLEIVIGDKTVIESSEKNFQLELPQPVVSEASTQKVCNIDLAALNDQAPYQRVAITAKVTNVAEVKYLDDGRQLQTVQIADKTGKAKLDLWQNHIGTLLVAKTYHIKNVMVKVYQDEYSLTTPKDGALTISKAEDIPGVPEELTPKPKQSLPNTKIIGVRALKSKLICVVCGKGEVILTKDNTSLGTCTKCSSTVLAAACAKQTTADLVIKSQTFMYYLSAKGTQLVTIAGENITEIMLLTAAEFNCEYNEEMVITNVSQLANIFKRS